MIMTMINNSSLLYYINDEVIKNKNVEYDLSNPYLYDSYNDYKSKEVRDDDIL